MLVRSTGWLVFAGCRDVGFQASTGDTPGVGHGRNSPALSFYNAVMFCCLSRCTNLCRFTPAPSNSAKIPNYIVCNMMPPPVVRPHALQTQTQRFKVDRSLAAISYKACRCHRSLHFNSVGGAIVRSLFGLFVQRPTCEFLCSACIGKPLRGRI